MSDIIPVFLGADLNCYNFARAFHEAYGVESYAYGRNPMAPTKYSKIIHLTTEPDMDNEDTMLRILHEFAAQHKGKRLYLFGCTDDYAAMIIRRKAELTEYIAPGPAAGQYGSDQKKAETYDEEHGAREKSRQGVAEGRDCQMQQEHENDDRYRRYHGLLAFLDEEHGAPLC